VPENGHLDPESFLPQPARRPGVLVLFGGAGALAQEKLLPALYNLAADGLLPERFAVLAVARTGRDDDAYRDLARQAVRAHSRRPVRTDVLDRLLGCTHYQAIRPDRQADFSALSHRLEGIDAACGTGGGRLFYLATPPEAYGAIIEALSATGLARCDADPPGALAVEKPFGRDRAAAEDLNRRLRRCFGESRIHRIDHYLGKETVQNLLVFRFANAVFEPLLNARHVHDVQITVAEDGGVGERGGHYDGVGALRDMVQSHLLQLLCLVAMERPERLSGEAIRDEKVKVLRAIAPPAESEVAERTVRGQYAAADGIAGYRREDGVAPDSATETYAAVRLAIENDRWAGVPFYLRTGKRLARRVAEIVVTFVREAGRLFTPAQCPWRSPNRLTFRLQPAEGIAVGFDAKVPGPRMLLRPVRLDFQYASTFEMPSPEAYERLLLDALTGEGSLFARADEVAASWEIVDAIRQGWDRRGAPLLRTYRAGTWGPDPSATLFADPETSWQTS